MGDLQSYVDEEFRKAPEEAMRLYDGKIHASRSLRIRSMIAGLSLARCSEILMQPEIAMAPFRAQARLFGFEFSAYCFVLHPQEGSFRDRRAGIR